MADNKNDNGQEFDDEFDVDDFSDMELDEAALEDDGDYAEAGIDEDNFIDEDYESEDWDEDEETSGKKSKKEKSLYTDGEKKGLSFNTMAIIGALVVGGGIMMFNIMNATAEQKAGQKSVFQSIMDMTGVMDGMIFGEAAHTPTPEEIAAQQQKTQEDGFLNNPEVAQAPITPPQPTPIAPSEEGGPLTPMPGMAETPRGPDDSPTPPPPVGADTSTAAQAPIVPPVEEGIAAPSETADAAPSPAEEPAVSAEDILKKAMENREQKAQDSGALGLADAPAPDAPAPETQSAAAPEELAPEPTPVPEQVPPLAAPPETAPVAAAPAAPQGPSAEDLQAVKDVEAKLDTLLKRMDQIETDLSAVKEEKGDDYIQIQQSVSALQQDLQTLKDRPAPSSAPAQTSRPKAAPVETAAEEAAPPAAETPKPAVRKQAAKKPAPSAAPAAQASRWELRAAQPGRAWVSRPGERDMQTVEVGQTLAGIGRVNAITYQEGRWTVYGTQGQIRQ